MRRLILQGKHSMCRQDRLSRAGGYRRDAAKVRPLAGTALLAIAITVAGCSTTTIKHGQQFQDHELQQVQAGMSQDQVRMSLGSPATSASLGAGNAYYYISSTMQQTAFFEPTETDRRVVAVYFSQAGTVERVANYGIKDGRVFDFISSSTPSANTREEGILRQMFRNIGQRQVFQE